MSIFDSFVKKHEYLICVDSDGCVMDTMNCKHFHCFGPCMVTEWGLEEWKDEILKRWNEINLFSMTRGINRFKGLAIALSEIHEKYKPITGIAYLQLWADTAIPVLLICSFGQILPLPFPTTVLPLPRQTQSVTMPKRC